MSTRIDLLFQRVATRYATSLILLIARREGIKKKDQSSKLGLSRKEAASRHTTSIKNVLISLSAYCHRILHIHFDPNLLFLSCYRAARIAPSHYSRP